MHPPVGCKRCRLHRDVVSGNPEPECGSVPVLEEKPERRYWQVPESEAAQLELLTVVITALQWQHWQRMFKFKLVHGTVPLALTAVV